MDSSSLNDKVRPPAVVVSERGIEGRASLVVELLSPRDESMEKLPFYLRVGVEEALDVSRSGAFEVRRPVNRSWVIVAPDADGSVTLASVPVRLWEAADGLGHEVIEPAG